MIKTYSVTYKTKEGGTRHTTALATDTRHAISSVQELRPDAYKITQVLITPEWT